MENNNNDDLNGKVEIYFKQYIRNYCSMNMEFAEFIASKLNCTENHAVHVIKTWKQNKQLINA
jgi:hypothetical protein